MDLHGSSRLTECPDFTTTPHLERLYLSFCESLRGIHPSIGVLRKLTILDLRSCIKLTSFPKSFGHLTSLKWLVLSSCLKLTSLPDCFGNMKCLEELDLTDSVVAELPASIVHLTALTSLRLSACKNLRRLPKGIGALKDLKTLFLTDCVKLDKLPEDFDDMGSSVQLYVQRTAIRKVTFLDYLNYGESVELRGCRHIKPDSFGSSIRRYSFCSPGKNITALFLNGCHLRWIPQDICLLHSLWYLNLGLNDFEYLPASMVQLSELSTLFLYGCDRLQQLPELSSSLSYLVADNCKSLRTICNPLVYTAINRFSFLNCSQLVESNLLSERLILNPFRVSNLLISSFKYWKCITPGCEIPKWFSHQNRMGSSISFQLPLDCCNDNLLGLLVCFVFEATDRGPQQSRMEIKGWSQECYFIHGNIRGQRTGDNVFLFALKYDASLTNGREIKIQPKNLVNIKVKKCGAHLLYKDDPIFSCLKSNDRGRNNNKKIPSSSNCDEDFSIGQVI
ncbi:hypothetical protein NMG60_11031628 [Bertholletia excelsa]